jgi:hypothetical protein
LTHAGGMAFGRKKRNKSVMAYASQCFTQNTLWIK